MPPIMRALSFALALFLLCSLLSARDTDPFSNIPADRRESLSKRMNGYLKAHKARDWERLYDFVSGVGKGGASQKTFVASMRSSHEKSFAQMPDLQEFKPDRAKTNRDGYDVYGCGKAEREGEHFEGIVVVHAVFERNDWYFTGWRFTEFPNEPCKALSNSNWKPENEMSWNTPMEELPNLMQQEIHDQPQVIE